MHSAMTCEEMDAKTSALSGFLFFDSSGYQWGIFFKTLNAQPPVQIHVVPCLTLPDDSFTVANVQNDLGYILQVVVVQKKL